MVFEIPGIKHLDTDNFFLIAGPCIIEDEKISKEIAAGIQEITDRLKIPFIFKASYKKANRSRGGSFTGIGDIKALELIREIGKTFRVPTLTDIHTVEEAQFAAEYVDVLQIPAFLCRQTELLVAAGNTGKPVNIKKGQFAAPVTMKFAVEKIFETGNRNVMVTERGTSFGYNDLVVDFRGIPQMQQGDVPVVLDVTHSLQEPNQSSGITGGRPEMISTLAKAGIAAGVDGIFLETHPDPLLSKSDGANMLKLCLLEDLLTRLVRIRKAL
jgi:2-dehydro-3-deoxyphosphooctonate aldolase (KDO 8-P synthase)